ncbi:hypothetical protein SAMN05428950_1011845 [Sphingomonas sp. OV641]|uniref:hypothetical protein n=1 Tax=Sphingomonas sp. OV641 TaxID=1881068 RepID=UPI0008CB5E25|nr:hypothetical protein [Sphingomonas sp. OV641]SEJ32455.1 hypothetical protein SAMN05428950_1011845 [Sphingomonas sp. OV641]
MSDPDQRSNSAGGFLLAVSLMVGTIMGLLLGQPSVGFLAGLAIGSIAAVSLWLKGRG